MCLPLGMSIGYWADLVTSASEQFGTNLRSTVTTTVPNFIRGAVVPITILFEAIKPFLGIVISLGLVGCLCVCLALWGLSGIKESFSFDLDFLET